VSDALGGLCSRRMPAETPAPLERKSAREPDVGSPGRLIFVGPPTGPLLATYELPLQDALDVDAGASAKSDLFEARQVAAAQPARSSC
jgi:hypothetical protein